MRGLLPNEYSPDLSPELYPIQSWHANSSNLCAWAARSNERGNFIAVASGNYGYQELNQTQCEVHFIPQIFNVSANVTSKRINIQPLESTNQELEPTRNLTSNAIQSINLLSRMSGSLYVSIIGDMLESNIKNMQSRQKVSHNAATDAVADSFTAMIGDILVAYGVSQIMLAQDTTSVPVIAIGYGVQIGDPNYTTATLALNLLILAIVLIELVRTRLWTGLPKFDYVNIKNVIVGSSAGGSTLASKIARYEDVKAVEFRIQPSNLVTDFQSITTTSSQENSDGSSLLSVAMASTKTAFSSVSEELVGSDLFTRGYSRISEEPSIRYAEQE